MKSVFILGPSGSGKTSLSIRLADVYTSIFGADSVTLVSLDPANCLSQKKDIQVNELVTVEDIMEQYEIGPNAAILYAMEFLLENIQWLTKKINETIQSIKKNSKNKYCNHLFIFDLPGQIQLYINTNTVKKIMQIVSKLITDVSGTSPCILQLFDCTYMHNVDQFISLCMMSLSTMINIEMPHINLLNKIDILKSAQSKPSRGLLNEFFRVTSASQLVYELKSPEQENEQTNADIIAKVIDTYGKVSFMPCSLFQNQLIANLVYEMECIFGSLQISIHQKKFMEFVKDVDQFSLDRAITNMENEFYEEEQQEMEKFDKDLQNS